MSKSFNAFSTFKCLSYLFRPFCLGHLLKDGDGDGQNGDDVSDGDGDSDDGVM